MIEIILVAQISWRLPVEYIRDRIVDYCIPSGQRSINQSARDSCLERWQYYPIQKMVPYHKKPETYKIRALEYEANGKRLP